MTNDDFGRLPLLLKAGQVMAVTGWDPRTLRKEAEAIPGLCFRMRSGQRRYRKTVLAVVVGWNV